MSTLSATGVQHPTIRASSPPPEHPAPPPSPTPPRWRRWLIVAALVLTTALWVFPLRPPSTGDQLTYSALKQEVAAGKVRSVALAQDGGISGTLTDGRDFTSRYPTGIQDPQFARLLDSHHVRVAATATPTPLGPILVSLLPVALLAGLLWWGRRVAKSQLAGIAGLGRSRARLFDRERPTTTFTDVAGYEGAKQEVSEVVDVLRTPERYRRAGAVGPKGVLMVGPPGTGKTLLARAVAGEAGVPFLSVTGSSFVEMFVGLGAARVRDLFAEARRRAPSIIFIDEVDAIGQRRGAQVAVNDERDQTLNQLLAEMDGFDPATGVVVIAATNRPEVLDPALLRPGRFDRQVVIPLPTLPERRAILAVHTAGKPLDRDVDLQVVARSTPGFSGADLANLVNEAAILAVRAGRQVVTRGDFADARDRILLGRRESSNVLSAEEKQWVAVHEAGHALVAALSRDADPVAKVTILPAGQALGVTEQLPVDERRLYTQGYLKDTLAVRMGGRVAENLVFGQTSSGAASDLAGATDLGTRMVREYGMSRALGPVGFAQEPPGYLGAHERLSRPYAEATQRLIDEEVATLLREAEQRAAELLTRHRTALDRLTALLLERETVDGEDVRRVLTINPVPTISLELSGPRGR